MPKSQSRKLASTKHLAQINILVSGLGRIVSSLQQKSKACYQPSSTSLQVSAVPVESSKLLSQPFCMYMALIPDFWSSNERPLMMVLNLLQRKGHWLNAMTCLYTRYTFLQMYFFSDFWITLIKPCISNVLSCKLFCEIGLFLDIEELKTVILVCRLVCDIYLPIYLSCYKFSLAGGVFSFTRIRISMSFAHIIDHKICLCTPVWAPSLMK